MKTLLSIDPGVHACGVAYFTDSLLTAAAYVKIEKDTPLAESAMIMSQTVYSWARANGRACPDDVVVELPQVYDRKFSKGDPNDLIAVAAICGAIATQFPRTKFVLPREWKRQIPKPEKKGDEYMIEVRVRERLSAAELACVELPSAKTLGHNVFDAIGIGMMSTPRRIA